MNSIIVVWIHLKIDIHSNAEITWYTCMNMAIIQKKKKKKKKKEKKRKKKKKEKKKKKKNSAARYSSNVAHHLLPYARTLQCVHVKRWLQEG